MGRVANVLYLTDHSSRLSHQRGALVVRRKEGGWARVPMEGLEAVVLASNAQMTTDALAACSDRGIRVTALRRNGAVRFTVGGSTKGNVLLRVAQVRAMDDPAQRAAIAKNIVAAKMRGSSIVLKRWSEDSGSLTRRRLERAAHTIESRVPALHSTTNGDRIRGIEGDAARAYFKGLGSYLEDRKVPFAFATRTRRPPRDPVNALLSFTYGVTLGEVTGALEAIGLDPQVGFLHGLRPGRPSLSLDLVEELRASIADRFVVKLLTRRQISADCFTITPGGGCYLSDEGRRRFFELLDEERLVRVPHRLLGRSVERSTLPLVQATLLARHLRGDLDEYPPFVPAR